MSRNAATGSERRPSQRRRPCLLAGSHALPAASCSRGAIAAPSSRSTLLRPSLAPESTSACLTQLRNVCSLTPRLSAASRGERAPVRTSSTASPRNSTGYAGRDRGIDTTSFLPGRVDPSDQDVHESGGTPPGEVFSGVDFASLKVYPNEPEMIYAGTTAGFLVSRDGGESWAHPSEAGG